MTSSFSAKGPMLGYIYQARYSLNSIMEGEEDSQLVIEGLDDVVFEDEGQPRELLQLKHHLNKTASLTDRSVELWKTLRIWSSYVVENKISLSDTSLTLITTAVAPENSIAALLRPGRSESNLGLAKEKLVAISEKPGNKALEPAFAAFKMLTTEDQLLLVGAIQILDASPGIEDMTTLIKKRLELSTRKKYLDSLYERLEGWWFDKVIQHLVIAREPITRLEVINKIRDIAEQFGDDVLPLDYWDLEVPDQKKDQNRLFVLQLKQISLISRRIELAILDYYRAFEQRSRWAREDLLNIHELENYEKRLLEEWERMYLKLQQDELNEESEDEAKLREFGRSIYDWMEFEADFKIRSKMAKDYILRGSYHMLADQKRVWWHPKFIERLDSLLAVPVA